jgi:thymidylate kinase
VYRAADVYLFPVAHPGACITLPLSVLEALACGTQVVATRFGALTEFYDVSHGVTFSNANGLVEAVEHALQHRLTADAAAVPAWSDVARRLISETAAPPKRRLILLLGLDGTGKSTHATLLADEARARGMRARTVWARWDPFLLLPVMRLARNAGQRGQSATEKDENLTTLKQRLFKRRALRALWSWLAAADHGCRTLPRLIRARRSADILIADRYYHDALVDLAANFGSDLPKPRGLHRLFPKPDAVVLLDAEESVLRSRKNDAPSEAYLHQRRPLYLALARDAGWPVVDASQPLADVQDEIRRHVWGER